MKIPRWIAAAALSMTTPCLLAGCQKSDPFAAGNHTPVNEAAMPTPDLTPPPNISGTAASPAPASTPGLPPATLAPSPNPLPQGP